MDNSTEDETLARAFYLQTTMLTRCKRSYDDLIQDLATEDTDDWLDALIDSLMEFEDEVEDYVQPPLEEEPLFDLPSLD